jgi:ketosteroid isomerase-like protein
MTKENLELVRGVIGDLRGLFDLFDDYIVWDNRAHSGVDRAEPIFGKQAVMADVRKWIGTWSDFTFEVEELIDAGDSVVLVLHERGQGRGSGAPMEHHYCAIWTFRHGRIIRGEAYATKAEALEALGTAPAPETESSDS